MSENGCKLVKVRGGGGGELIFRGLDILVLSAGQGKEPIEDPCSRSGISLFEEGARVHTQL